MHARRGGIAMASHGRHILLENVAAISTQRRAKKLAAKIAALVLVAGLERCASFPMDANERSGLAPICYQWTMSGVTKLMAGCRPELTTPPAAPRHAAVGTANPS